MVHEPAHDPVVRQELQNESLSIDSTTVSPFRWRSRPHGIAVLIERLVVFPTIGLLRLAVVFLLALFAAPYCVIVTLGASETTRPHPLRRLLLQPLRAACRAFLWSLGYWWIKIDDRRDGAARRAPERILIAAPHTTILDPIVLAYLELPCSVARKEVKSMPIFGAIASSLQCIYVDRDDPQSKRRAIASIKARTIEEGWPPLLIFPEGACTNGDSLISFKPGAFLPGAPVQPVVLHYAGGVALPAGSAREANIRIFLAALHLRNELRVTYLPPYRPTEAEVRDPALFARGVRDVMAEARGLPCCEASFRDQGTSNSEFAANPNPTRHNPHEREEG